MTLIYFVWQVLVFQPQSNKNVDCHLSLSWCKICVLQVCNSERFSVKHVSGVWGYVLFIPECNFTAVFSRLCINWIMSFYFKDTFSIAKEKPLPLYAISLTTDRLDNYGY